MRIDLFLVEKGFFSSRNKAQEAIRDNCILVDNKIITKNSVEVNESNEIRIIANKNPYVSRGGLKLEKAIHEFNLDFSDKIILDIGASTGGFTDCSLKCGAKLVYAVDVGTNQLHSSLLANDKVISYENTNILDLHLPSITIDYIVMDVSFVSIEHLINGIDRFFSANTKWVCLIKPQFELGNIKMKNGIVKDKKLHLFVLNKVNSTLIENGYCIFSCIPSPIKGGSGNIEFLALIGKGQKNNIDFKKIIEDAWK